MPYAHLADAQIYYEEHGSGIPLVLAHGFNTSGRTWERLAPGLASRYRVIVPDLRGHGRSTGAPETIHHERFAADLVALLDHLGVERAHFVGHSSGGMCLLFVGTRYPERARTLALVSATHTYDERARRQMLAFVDGVGDRPDTIAALQRHHAAVHGDDYWKVLLSVFRRFAADPGELPFGTYELRAIVAPVLILHGDRDPFFPVDVPVTMYHALPNAELCILPGVGHYPPRECPDLLLRVLLRFLERQDAAGSSPEPSPR